MSHSTKDTDCSICRTDMGIPNYEENETENDVSINETVLRLSCGHAFHCACIAFSLRQHSECPVCRNSGPTEEESSVDDILNEIRVVLYGNGNSNDTSLPEFVYQIQENIGDIQVLEEKLHTIRTTNTDVQHARQQYKRVLRTTHELSTTLQKQRKEILSKAFAELRQKHRNHWERQKRKLQRTIRIVQQKEQEALEKQVGIEESNKLLKNIDYTYSTKYALQNQFPMRQSFWK